MELFLIWFFCSVIAGLIGAKKGAGCSGLFVGFLLGPLGIIIALIMSGNRIKCPYCKKEIDPKAMKCPYCQSDITEKKILEGKKIVYCHNCGTANPDDFVECRKCSYKLLEVK